MASCASGQAKSGLKAYDFASDDIPCSHNHLNNHESSNNSDPGTGANSIKEFSKSRMARPFSANSYNQPEEYPSQDMISIVENTMKKYTDNLMQFVEGISSRLSQLELYCYNLDKSIGEMRSDVVRDHEEADSRLKFIKKHVQEVHMSVQIVRDKQELAETQKELAKILPAQKESSSTSQSKRSEDRAAATPAPQPQTPSYYLPQTQLPNPQIQTQSRQGQYMPSNSQYGTPPQVHPYPHDQSLEDFLEDYIRGRETETYYLPPAMREAYRLPARTLPRTPTGDIYW